MHVMLSKLKQFCIFLILLKGTMIGQNQARNWYFGNNAGLNFAGGTPTLATGGALTNSLGCAAISGANGNLLFYTDGVTVYNSTHSVMANGTGLHGQNASQPAIILKQPQSNNIFYIFTVGGSATSMGLKYSIVDMSLASGQGSITTKNNLIDANCRDKLTAGKHCNGDDVWVVSICATTAGIISVPLTYSGVGIPIFSGNNIIAQTGYGELKLSPNSKKIALAVNNYTPGPLTYYNSRVFVLDFNNLTGSINSSSPSIMYSMSGSMTFGNPRTFNCEFSPTSNNLYWSRAILGTSNLFGSIINRFDVCGTSSSYTPVYNTDSYAQDTITKATFQLASDGKIYVASPGKSSLGAINNPNNINASASYTNMGISLGTLTCQLGLPNFPGFYFEQKPNSSFSYTVNGSCQNVLFSTPPVCSASGYSISGYQWNFGDNASGSNNTSFLASPSHSFTNTGNYTVSLIRYFQCNTNDTITQVVSIVQPSINILTANACAMGTATAQVINGTGPYTYSWSVGSQSNAVFSYSTSGIYSVNVIDQGAGYCSRTSTFNLLVPTGGVSISITPSILCNGASNASVSASVIGGSGSYSYSWSANGINAPTLGNLGVGTYSLIVHDNTQNCNYHSTFNINQANALGLQINVLNNMVCEGGTIQINAAASGGVGPYTYTWMPNASNTQNQNLALNAGNYTYTVAATDPLNCGISNTVSFIVAPNPSIIVSQSSVCAHTSTVMSASGANTYTWQPNIVQSNSILVSPLSNMVYTVSGSNVYNCVDTKTVLLVVLPAPITNVQNNSPICEGQIANFNASFNQSYFWQGPNNFTANVPNPQINNTPVQNAGNYTLHVIDINGCKDSVHLNLIINPLPPVWINSNTTLTCIGQMVNLSGIGANTYHWSNNSNLSGITIIPNTNTVISLVGTNTITNCSATASIAIAVKECNTSGIKENQSSEKQFQVYPNPSNGEFIVNCNESGAYELMNMLGQVMSKGNIIKGENKLEFKTLEKGTYILKCTSHFTIENMTLLIE